MDQTKSKGDECYSIDHAALTEHRTSKPWMSSPTYFHTASFSPSSSLKILSHCQSGVTKGLKQSGKPVEVMGLLQGRPDPSNPGTIIVTDSFPLPIEGFETRVIADDSSVINHMIALGDLMEDLRPEKFCGWYHSHPFDVTTHPHTFFSSTDLSTQLQWQRSEDSHGNPWLGCVIDPLRSMSTSELIMESFRAFPPEYTPVDKFSCPDGSVVKNESERLQRWGACFNRYYRLDTVYHMSTESNKIVRRINEDFKWVESLTGGSGSDSSRIVKAVERWEEGKEGRGKARDEFKDIRGKRKAEEAKRKGLEGVFGV
ncbi:hypothetical protein TrST_g8917 [Triparma strigata]|uniref:MPN domain-containing protein n=1 Tax=Triparma strigata TaxID=1606541 RepID=A0A9W7AZB0_9STRA|nr:hypothetical protein TrST_g8917 [Triparma strigata]